MGAALGLGRPPRALPLEPWACVLHFSTSLPIASGPLMRPQGLLLLTSSWPAGRTVPLCPTHARLCSLAPTPVSSVSPPGPWKTLWGLPGVVTLTPQVQAPERAQDPQCPRSPASPLAPPSGNVWAGREHSSPLPHMCLNINQRPWQLLCAVVRDGRVCHRPPPFLSPICMASPSRAHRACIAVQGWPQGWAMCPGGLSRRAARCTGGCQPCALQGCREAKVSITEYLEVQRVPRSKPVHCSEEGKSMSC